MNYLLKKEDRFYFNSRVPAIFCAHDTRGVVRFALNTDSKKEAARLAFIKNEQIETYWKKLVKEGKKYCDKEFNVIINDIILSSSEKEPDVPIASKSQNRSRASSKKTGGG